MEAVCTAVMAATIVFRHTSAYDANPATSLATATARNVQSTAPPVPAHLFVANATTTTSHTTPRTQNPSTLSVSAQPACPTAGSATVQTLAPNVPTTLS